MRFILENTFGFGTNLSKFLRKCSNRANKLHSTCHSVQLEVAKLDFTNKNYTSFKNVNSIHINLLKNALFDSMIFVSYCQHDSNYYP